MDEQEERGKEGEEEADAEAAAAAAMLTKKVSKALRQAGEGLGKALGAMDKMFEEGAFTNGSLSRFGSTIYKGLPLRAAIKDLSP